MQRQPTVQRQILVGVGLNIFNSGIKYTEKDWVRHKARHYPLVGVDNVIKIIGLLVGVDNVIKNIGLLIGVDNVMKNIGLLVGLIML